MTVKIQYFIVSIALAFTLCMAQVLGSSILILGILGVYLVFLGWCCSRNFTIPILLFFLPWSTIMRLNPSSYSFYTFGMILICAISLVRQKFRLKRYHIVVGIVLVFLTLVAKLLDGSSISFSYIAFIMLIVLFPVVKEEWKAGEYDFFQMVLFFASGVVVAALCAQHFATYHNISRYIAVYSYLTITRMCGFYGDPNFYTAQITAALSGALLAVLREEKKSRSLILSILIFLLLYCGFLSGSKSFVLVSGGILVLWIVELLRMRGRPGLKMVIILGSIIVAVYIATSALFSDLIQVIVTRLTYSDDISGFTTGRTDLWLSYLDALFDDGKLLLLGKGFTNAKVNGRASHNTILQMVFQFGILGTPVLAIWIACFFGDCGHDGSLRGQIVSVLILLIGSFFPWMAIDALFFDEFFLLQMYVFLGVQQLRSHRENANSNNGRPIEIASRTKRRIRNE